MATRADKHKYFPNPLRNMKRAVRESVAEAVEETADHIVNSTKELLLAQHGDGVAWTGELYNSISRDAVNVKPNRVSVNLYADATNPNNGAMYAQFLEEGTGDQGSGNGEKKWRYMGRDGNWYTTSGMKAEPFLSPPIPPALKELQERTRANIVSSFHTGWYEGSQQLWSASGNSGSSGSGIIYKPSNKGSLKRTQKETYYVKINNEWVKKFGIISR